MKYRSDIDGLRAIAVVSVIIFHYFNSTLHGGFFGVDIFFTISGYLISTLIFEEINNNNFSISNFYARRILRIIPALYIVILFSIIMSLLFLYAFDIIETSKSAIAAIFSVSNLYFSNTTDYFADNFGARALLHTWSLGVEEQFYIFFPILIIFISKFGQKIRNLIILIAFAISFLITLYCALIHDANAFYSPFARAWQLLAGTILASGMIAKPKDNQLANFAPIIGILLILYSFSIRKSVNYLPLYGVLPVLGAGLIIYYGALRKGIIYKILSLKGFNFIGKISYSLYLWHWPIFKIFLLPLALLFTKISNNFIEADTVGIFIFFLVFPIAYLSTKYIENPFRKLNQKIDNKTIFKIFGISLFAMLGICLLAINHAKSPEFTYSKQNQLTQFVHENRTQTYRIGKCFLVDSNVFKDFDYENCLKTSNQKPNILLYGDSHAAHLYFGLNKELDANIMQANIAGCIPIYQKQFADDNCGKMRDFMFNKYLRTNRPDTLILAGLWRKRDIEAIEETLDWANANNIKIILIGPNIRFDFPLPNILAYAEKWNLYDILDNVIHPKSKALAIEMEKIAKDKNVQYINIYNKICIDKKCNFIINNAPLESDASHLTAQGSIYIAQQIEQDIMKNN